MSFTISSKSKQVLAILVWTVLAGSLFEAGYRGRMAAFREARAERIANAALRVHNAVKSKTAWPAFLNSSSPDTNASGIRAAWMEVDPVSLKSLEDQISLEQNKTALAVRFAQAVVANAKGNFADALASLKSDDEGLSNPNINNRSKLQLGLLEACGDALAVLGKTQRGLELYGEAEKLDPSNAFHLARIADLQYSMGNTNEAFNDCDQLIDLQVEKGDALLGSGKADAALENYARAVGIETRLMELNATGGRLERLLTSQIRKGRAEMLLSKNTEALKDVQGALELVSKFGGTLPNGAREKSAEILRTLGAASLAHGKVEAAAEYYTQWFASVDSATTEGAKRSEADLANAHNNLGSCYLARQKFDLAETEFNKAISIAKDQSQEKLGLLQIETAIARNNLGVLQRVRKQDNAGLKEFETSISVLENDDRQLQMQERSTNGANVLVDVLFGYSDRGFEVIARARLRSSAERRALALATALKNRGHAEQSMGREDGARTNFDRAIKIYANLLQENSFKDLNLPVARALLPMAWIYATSQSDGSRDAQRAQVYAYKACELSDWKLPVALETLAAAYAEGRNFPDAVKCQQQVVQMASPRQKPDQIARLELYQQGRPYRTGANRSGSGEIEMKQ